MEDITQILPVINVGGVSILVLIMILVTILKQFGISSRWLPASAMIFGVVLGIVGFFTNGIDLPTAIIGGLLAGASVSGVYDFGRRTILGK